MRQLSDLSKLLTSAGWGILVFALYHTQVHAMKARVSLLVLVTILLGCGMGFSKLSTGDQPNREFQEVPCGVALFEMMDYDAVPILRGLERTSRQTNLVSMPRD